MVDDRYQVRLGVFEGPMDLLLYLIRKNEVDIYDIPISDITDQYLAYIEMMKSMNIDLAGDFLVMAATLMQIKSRMLLPVHGIEGEDEDEDPRMALVRPLTEYLQMADAAERMGRREMLGDTVFARAAEPLPPPDPGEQQYIRVGLFELVDAFQRILANLDEAAKYTMRADTVSVKERIQQISDLMEERQTLSFDELFDGLQTVTRGDVVVTFLAVLEMCKLELLRIVQHVQTGAIRLFYA
ncbi:MAG: segregation and condensation protein A [Desulfatibacillaceae bacterium]